MRRAILIAVTLMVLVGLFVGLLWTQRSVRQTAETVPPQPATRPTGDDAQAGSFGHTRSAWLYIFDTEVTGKPKVRFRGDELIPQTGDQVFVERPQVEFFIGPKREEVVRIIGKTGLVIMPGEGPRIRSDLSPTRTSPPTRGQMTDVTVWYFPSEEAAAADKAEMVMTLPNAYFDNDRYEIATEDYVDATGKKIPASEVPVRIRGESFDFDGRGLAIRWDEKTQRLRSLVVNHGEQLVIKRALDQVRGGQASNVVPGIQLAAADSAQALKAVAASADRIYRATFHQEVVVTQQDTQLATGSAMHVDFLDRSSPDTAPGTPAAQPKPARPAAPAQAPAEAAEAKSRTRGGLDPDQPVVIRWAGQLTVGAAPEEPLRPDTSNDAVIRLAGSDTQPARVFSEGRTIEAQWLAYKVQEQFAWVEGTQDRPVRMTDTDGSVLTTPQLRYSERNGVAELRGPSTAHVTSVEDGEKQTLQAQWRDIAEARFAREGESHGISSLLLRGAVQVQHPRIREFSSGELLLDFEQPATSEKSRPSGQLKRLVARKDVNCVLLDDKGETQSIRSQELDLAMAKGADGKTHPTRVVAVGSVVAGNAAETIAGDRIEADLNEPQKSTGDTKPTGPQYAGLRNLLAIGNVQLKSARGELVKGDRLQMRQTPERKSWVLLEGKPATVAQQGTVLAGQFIELDTASERALVTGGGELQLADNKTLGKGAQPVHVKWTGDGRLDGPADKVTVLGDVQVRYVDSDGAINEAASDRVEIGLGKKEVAPDAKQKSDRRLNFMSDRFARQITMLPSEGREVRLQSLLPGEGNSIRRQINLYGPRLDVLLEQTQTGGSRIARLIVPGSASKPGRMLYVDLPPATRQPVKTGDPLQSRNLPGATAFAWRERLEYDRASSQVTMTGGVMIRHEPQLPAGKSFQIDAQTIVADVIAKQDAATSGPASAMEVRKLTLIGSPVHLVREDIDMVAPMVEVDPSTSMVVATGSDLALVHVERGRVTGDMRRVEINTKTNMINFEGAQATGRQ